MRFPQPVVAAAVLLLLVLCQAGLAHAAPGSAQLGSGLVATLLDWLQNVIAPGLIIVGLLATAGSFLAGGARQGMMTGLGVIIAGVLCYSGPAILAFIRDAAGA